MPARAIRIEVTGRCVLTDPSWSPVPRSRPGGQICDGSRDRRPLRLKLILSHGSNLTSKQSSDITGDQVALDAVNQVEHETALANPYSTADSGLAAMKILSPRTNP